MYIYIYILKIKLEFILNKWENPKVLLQKKVDFTRGRKRPSGGFFPLLKALYIQFIAAENFFRR